MARSFSDVRRDRDGGFAHLRCETEEFGTWEAGCNAIDELRQIHRFSPRDEIAKTLNAARHADPTPQTLCRAKTLANLKREVDSRQILSTTGDEHRAVFAPLIPNP